jgi:hypothetical protein
MSLINLGMFSDYVIRFNKELILSMLSHGIDFKWFIYLCWFGYMIDIKTKNNFLLWRSCSIYAKIYNLFILFLF